MSKHKTPSGSHNDRHKSIQSPVLGPAVLVPVGAAIVALAVFVVYLPSISGEFIWDDETLLTKNSLVKAADGLQRIWLTTEPMDFWPLTNSAFRLQWRLWGMDSAGYHVTNLVLHIAASLLIWAILRTASIPGAFLAALIFALHPVNVESVAWIAQLKNTLSMMFFLLSILWYLKTETSMARVPTPALHPSSLLPHRSSLGHCYWLSFAAFASAMLSKGSAAVLPLIVLIIIGWRRRLTKRDLLRTVPFFMVAFALTWVNIWFRNLGAGAVIRQADLLERVVGAGAVVWFYLYKAVLPVNLFFVYPQWNIHAGDFLWWLPLLSATAMTVVLWLYRRTWSRPFLFAWGFVCLSLVPVLGFTDVGFMKYSLVADHYQHIAIMGAIGLATAAWSAWHSRTQPEKRWLINSVAVLVLGTLAILTWQQSRLYVGPLDLYQATLKRNPGCWALHNNLGLILEAKGLQTEAMNHYEESVRINPANAEAYNNMGGVFVRTGRLPEAIEQFELALHYKPNFAEAHNNLGMVLVNVGRPRDAITHFNETLRLDPTYAETQNSLGQVLVWTGHPDEAIEHYERALALKVGFPEAQYNLGLVLLQSGRYPEAIVHFEQLLETHPDYYVAHSNLGTALLRSGRVAEAIEHYEQAQRINPDYIQAYLNLAMAYALANRSADAVACARKGLELARSRQQMDLAGQFEEFLDSLRE
jgi:protein O-mannosyl-transferase